jgi:hypothetical protein
MAASPARAARYGGAAPGRGVGRPEVGSPRRRGQQDAAGQRTRAQQAAAGDCGEKGEPGDEQHRWTAQQPADRPPISQLLDVVAGRPGFGGAGLGTAVGSPGDSGDRRLDRGAERSGRRCQQRRDRLAFARTGAASRQPRPDQPIGAQQHRQHGEDLVGCPLGQLRDQETDRTQQRAQCEPHDRKRQCDRREVHQEDIYRGPAVGPMAVAVHDRQRPSFVRRRLRMLDDRVGRAEHLVPRRTDPPAEVNLVAEQR